MYCKRELISKMKIKKVLGCFILIVLMSISTFASEPIVAEGEKIPEFSCEEDFGIRNALAMLGSMCGKNIVPSPSVDGQLAFRSLRDVTFEEAMNAILGDNFVYGDEGSLIKVYTKEEYTKIMADPARRIYKVFTLYYMSAEEAVKLISPVLSDNVKIESSTAVETVSTTGESITTGTGGGDTMALNDMIVILDYPERIAEAEELLAQLDVRPRQVLVEATILSATLTEGMELGVDLNFWGGASIQGTEASAADAYNSAVSESTPIGSLANSSRAGTPLESSGFANVGGSGLKIGVTSGDFAAIITALEEVTDTTVLANPKILAVMLLDNFDKEINSLGRFISVQK